MERRQLECFLVVSESGSMAEAARKLLVSQPALSQTIKALEREIGTPLFHRLPRGVKLTSAGESLMMPARQVLRDFDTAAERVRAVRGIRSGVLDLVSLPGLVQAPLAPWLGRYCKHWPGIKVRIEQAETPAEVAEMVRTGAAELGFTVDASSAHDLQSTYMGTQELVAILPPRLAGELGSEEESDDPHCVTLAQLMRVGLVTGRKGTFIRDLADRIAQDEGREWHPLIEVERREAALSFVRAGVGAAVLPRASGEAVRGQGLRVLPLKPRILRQVLLLQRTGPLSPAAAAFCNLASAVVPER